MKYMVYLRTFQSIILLLLLTQEVVASSLKISNICKNNLGTKRKEYADCLLKNDFDNDRVPAMVTLSLDAFKAACHNKNDYSKFIIDNELSYSLDVEKLRFNCHCLQATGKDLCNKKKIKKKLKKVQTYMKESVVKPDLIKNFLILVNNAANDGLDLESVCGESVESFKEKFSCLGDLSIIDFEREIRTPGFNTSVHRGFRRVLMRNFKKAGINIMPPKAMKDVSLLLKNEAGIDLSQYKNELFEKARTSENVLEVINSIPEASLRDLKRINFTTGPSEVQKAYLAFYLDPVLNEFVGLERSIEKEKLKEYLEQVKLNPHKSPMEVYNQNYLKKSYVKSCMEYKDRAKAACKEDDLDINEIISTFERNSRRLLYLDKSEENLLDDYKAFSEMYCMLSSRSKFDPHLVKVSQEVNRSFTISSNTAKRAPSSIESFANKANIEVDKEENIERLVKAVEEDGAQALKEVVIQRVNELKYPEDEEIKISSFDQVQSTLNKHRSLWKNSSSNLIDTTLDRYNTLQSQVTSILNGASNYSPKERERIFSEFTALTDDLEKLTSSNVSSIEGKLARDLATAEIMNDRINSYKEKYPLEEKKTTSKGESKKANGNIPKIVIPKSNIVRAKEIDQPGTYDFDEEELSNNYESPTNIVSPVSGGSQGGGNSSGGQSSASSKAMSSALPGSSTGRGPASITPVNENYGFIVEDDGVNVESELKKLIQISDVYVLDPKTRVLHKYENDNKGKQKLVESFDTDWVVSNNHNFPNDVVNRVKKELIRVKHLYRLLDN